MPATYGLCFVVPALFSPGSSRLVAGGIVLLFCFGLILMKGYWRLWRGERPWPGEGWIFGWTALANALATILVWPQFLTLESVKLLSRADSNTGLLEMIFSLTLVFVLFWWPFAMSLGGWAWWKWFWYQSKQPDLQAGGVGSGKSS